MSSLGGDTHHPEEAESLHGGYKVLCRTSMSWQMAAGKTVYFIANPWSQVWASN